MKIYTVNAQLVGFKFNIFLEVTFNSTQFYVLFSNCHLYKSHVLKFQFSSVNRHIIMKRNISNLKIKSIDIRTKCSWVAHLMSYHLRLVSNDR